MGRWRAVGHEAQLFLFTRDETYEAANVPETPVVGRHGGPISRVVVMNDLISRIRRFRPDVLYWRSSTFYAPILRNPRSAALVVEVNTHDVHEYALGYKTRRIYNRLTRGVLLGRARALVFVTPELAQAGAFRAYPADRYVIANGIDLDVYPQLPAPCNDHPTLAFVGSPGQRWHGVDKLVALAAMRPQWRFDIVGEDAPAGPVSSNVTFHGVKDRAGVLDVLARADVGVATLALHRKSMEQSSSLKMREYLAVGLPVIYAGSDPDVDDIVPHVLRIPNTESGVMESAADIDQFVRAARGARVPRDCIAHLHVERKERERLAIFEGVLRSTGKGAG